MEGFATTKSVIFLKNPEPKLTLKEVAEMHGEFPAELFYKPVKKEQVSATKKIILRRQSDDVIFEMVAKNMPQFFKNVKIPGKVQEVDGFDVFIQSTSSNRGLVEGQELCFYSENVGKPQLLLKRGRDEEEEQNTDKKEIPFFGSRVVVGKTLSVLGLGRDVWSLIVRHVVFSDLPEGTAVAWHWLKQSCKTLTRVAATCRALYHVVLEEAVWKDVVLAAANAPRNMLSFHFYVPHENVAPASSEPSEFDDPLISSWRLAALIRCQKPEEKSEGFEMKDRPVDLSWSVAFPTPYTKVSDFGASLPSPGVVLSGSSWLVSVRGYRTVLACFFDPAPSHVNFAALKKKKKEFDWLLPYMAETESAYDDGQPLTKLEPQLYGYVYSFGKKQWLPLGISIISFLCDESELCNHQANQCMLRRLLYSDSPCGGSASGVAFWAFDDSKCKCAYSTSTNTERALPGTQCGCLNENE